MTESAGRARLIALFELRIARCYEIATVHEQLSSGREESEIGRLHIEIAKTRRDCALELEHDLKEFLAAEALAGQEEAPQQKDDEEEDHARGGSVPGTEHGDLPHRTTGKP